ncbi:hypothetical protein [Caulobacter sp. NIBR1757]|uniref:hypothetical protein n=1 Tax=Caulobacter sp. NIBR1757 TaxID=3016000 RepID=UPI0022F07FFB|nr:hypothetical protein [Caulobacter sp. NIBR1757]WGM40046.1 hypothetical protein AMEJIAPC_02987 [Caulobacter sp. NIBR1757]
MRAFTTAGYGALLTAFSDAGYEAVDLEALDAGRRHVFLRHDVDFSPEYCAPIARAEIDVGYRSTFYFLVTSPFYNILDPAVRDDLRRLSALGHAIGLHFDASLYPEGPQLEEQAERERMLLESVADAPVRSISFHRPAPSLVGRPGHFAGRPHTYQPQFVEAIAYYSDSQGAWRFGHPLDSEAFARAAAMQLLTHPIWWCIDVEETPTARLNRWLGHRLEQQVADVGRNCKSYDPSLIERRAPGAGRAG